MVSPTFHRKKTKRAKIELRVTPRFKQLVKLYGGLNTTAYIERLVENDIRRKKRRESNAD